MSRITTPSEPDLEQTDRVYREGGLRAMAPPHVRYVDGKCPHNDCGQPMEWIDFKLELFGDAEEVYKPLVRSWWEGPGFVGRCPNCRGWVRFTTRRMEALTDETASQYPRLPDDWHAVAEFA